MEKQRVFLNHAAFYCTIAIFMIAVIDTDNGYTVLCHLHSDDLLESYLESVQLFSVAVFVFHNSSILRMNVKP